MRVIDALTMDASNIEAIGPIDSSDSSSRGIPEFNERDMSEISGTSASYLGFLSLNRNFLFHLFLS